VELIGTASEGTLTHVGCGCRTFFFYLIVCVCVWARCFLPWISPMTTAYAKIFTHLLHLAIQSHHTDASPSLPLPGPDAALVTL